ncbi:MAG: hypothetical protein J3Q66DRAFT_410841 [Benniella sp.]|nr:MAG: hypothetical protein J3Q66DRAFT_410841 [Benniella sp.]
MFDIPELDEMVCRKLRRRDLAMCARVCKAWHRVIIPFLWRDTTLSGSYRKTLFSRVVMEDYLYELRQQKAQESEHAMDQLTQPSWLSSLPALTKYCRWIQKASAPKDLLACFQPSKMPLQQRQTLLEQLGKVKDQTGYELLRHFYKRCPVLQVESMYLSTTLDLEPRLWKTMMEDVVLHVRHLHIGSNSDIHRFDVQDWRLKCLLDRLSSTLASLSVEHCILRSNVKMNGEWDEKEDWPLLKELKLLRCYDSSGSRSLWPWLWRRCGHVEQLVVRQVDGGIVDNLVEGIAAHIPNLDKLQLEAPDNDEYHLDDPEIGKLLSSSRKGWKVVSATISECFGPYAVETLLKHSSTLEVLKLDGCLTGANQVHVLSTCPNLHTLALMDNEIGRAISYPISAETFIDMESESDTDSLKTWSCEKSLKVLKVMIRDIPRSDTEWAYIEEYPGQSRKIQGLVYDRLARLTNLEVLWLGYDCSIGEDEYGSGDFQYTCLEMSLESGLRKLSGLKKLRELNVSYMKTKIDLEEVQWMAEHWPKLEVIYGLDEKGGDEKAVTWLREHCPTIDTPEIRYEWDAWDE